MIKKKTNLKDEFKPTFSDDGDTVLSGGKRFSKQHYEEDLKSQQQYDRLIDKLFISSTSLTKEELINEFRECKIESGVPKVHQMYIMIDGMATIHIQRQPQNHDKVSLDYINETLRKLFEIDVLRHSLIQSLNLDELDECTRKGHPISRYQEMWGLFKDLPHSVLDKYMELKYSEDKPRELTQEEIASIVRKPKSTKKPADTIKDINVPRLQFPQDAKWVNVKFKYITDVEIEIHYAGNFIGLFPHTSLDGFYKGRTKTNLWHGLLYIAQKGSIDRTILEELSKDAPRKYIDRLNKALERAFFKEEDQRPIKSETIKSSKYYVPRFGVIDAQLS